MGTVGVVAVDGPDITAFQSGIGTAAHAASRAQATSVASTGATLPAPVAPPFNQRTGATVLNTVRVIFVIMVISTPANDSVAALAMFADMLPVRPAAGLTVRGEIFTKMQRNLQFPVFLGKWGDARVVSPFPPAIAPLESRS
jgi:hypothetical protein